MDGLGCKIECVFLSGVGALIYGLGLLVLRALPERRSL